MHSTKKKFNKKIQQKKTTDMHSTKKPQTCTAPGAKTRVPGIAHVTQEKKMHTPVCVYIRNNMSLIRQDTNTTYT